MKLRMALTGVLAVAGMLGAGQASAAFSTGGYCGAGTATGGISVTNMTLNGNNASDCYGIVSIGGNVAGEISNINDLGWGTYSVANYLKDDTAGSATQDFLGLRWTLAAANGSNNSTYTLTVQDLDLGASPSLPFTVDIVGFLKAGTPGAFYFFDDAVIDTSNGGTFKIVWPLALRRRATERDLSAGTRFARASRRRPGRNRRSHATPQTSGLTRQLVNSERARCAGPFFVECQFGPKEVIPVDVAGGKFVFDRIVR